MRRDRARRQSASARTAHALGADALRTYPLESRAGPEARRPPNRFGRATRARRSLRTRALVSSNPCVSSTHAMIARRTRTRSWLFAAVVPIAVAGAVYAAAQAKLAGDREPLYAYRLRFGMTPADVRATFAAPTAEDSRWRVDSSAEPALEWRGRNRSFRFEFHNAQLMAVRAVVESRDPSTHGRALEVSTAAVLRRVVREDGRVELTLVARDCPSHAEEARRLVASQ